MKTSVPETVQGKRFKVEGVSELTDEMRADGWVDHDGGPRPYGLKFPVEIMFRDEQTDVAERAKDFEWRWASFRFDDYDGEHYADIIAYKPAPLNA